MKKSNTRFYVLSALTGAVSAFIVLGALFLTSCQQLTAKSPDGGTSTIEKVATDVGAGLTVAECVLEHQDEEPVTIVKNCAGTTIDSVNKILSANRRGMAKRCTCAAVSDAGAEAGVKPFNAGIGK